MAIKAPKLTIRFPQDASRRIHEVSQQRGFLTPDAYVKSLIDADAVQHSEDPIFEADDDDPVEDFRRAWADAMKGNVVTWDELVKAVKDDD
jgi:hypothetical protein